MRTACLAALILVVCADPALDYEARVREAFKEFQATVEAIAEDTENADPDRLVPALVSRRHLWVNKDDTGFFHKVHSGHWVERVPNGDANILVEVSRKEGYIELSNVNGQALIRLYEDRCDVMLKSAKQFKTFYRGEWKEQ